MDRMLHLTASMVFLCLLLSGCGTAGESECSCAAGTTYEGTFYQEYADTSVRAKAPIGSSDQVGGCCGEGQPRVTIYSIEGIEPEIAVATRNADGESTFNVASDLPEQKQAVADQFAKKHHHLSDPP